MKTFIISVCSVFLIIGCSWNNNPDIVIPEQKIVKQVEYIIRIPPAQHLTIAPYPQKIDIDKAKQSDAAKMLVASEERIKQLENQLIGIGEFFTSETEKLNIEASKINAEALKNASK